MYTLKIKIERKRKSIWNVKRNARKFLRPNNPFKFAKKITFFSLSGLLTKNPQIILINTFLAFGKFLKVCNLWRNQLGIFLDDLAWGAQDLENSRLFRFFFLLFCLNWILVLRLFIILRIFLFCFNTDLKKI